MFSLSTNLVTVSLIEKGRLEEAGVCFSVRFEHGNSEMPIYRFWVDFWT